MTAADILQKWKRVADVLGRKTGPWLTLLRIAEQGSKGARASDLCHGDQALYSSRLHSLRMFERAGLIEATDKLSRRGARIYVITAKGLQFLDLDPVTP